MRVDPHTRHAGRGGWSGFWGRFERSVMEALSLERVAGCVGKPATPQGDFQHPSGPFRIWDGRFFYARTVAPVDSRAHCATRPIEHGVDRLLPSVFERSACERLGELMCSAWYFDASSAYGAVGQYGGRSGSMNEILLRPNTTRTHCAPPYPGRHAFP